MGTRVQHLNVTVPNRRRRLLFAALLVMNIGYIFAYFFFVSHSENFIIAQHNRSAAEFSRVHPAILPAYWQFGKDSADNARLGYGWIMPWKVGAWMVANNAWITFAPVQRDSDLILTFNIAMFSTPASPPNRVEVSVNGQTLGSWEHNGPDSKSSVEVRVPRALLRAGECRVRIHIDHVKSLYRPDVGSARNGQQLVLTDMTVRKTDSLANVH